MISTACRILPANGVCVQDFVWESLNQTKTCTSPFTKKNAQPNILHAILIVTSLSTSRQYDLRKIWELINDDTSCLFCCYFMCDIKHHFVVLCTVLQLPHSLKCKRELSCPCWPPHLLLVSEMVQEAQSQRITGGWTPQHPSRFIHFCRVTFKPFQLLQSQNHRITESQKASMKASPWKHLWNCPICFLFDNSYWYFPFEFSHSWGNFLRQ